MKASIEYLSTKTVSIEYKSIATDDETQQILFRVLTDRNQPYKVVLAV